MRRIHSPLSIVLGVGIAAAASICRADDMASAKPVDFTHDDLPILARACFDCHGVDAQESALRLDVQQVAFAGDGRARLERV